MKKFKWMTAAVLCLVLLTGLMGASAEVGNGYIGYMQVVNCDSWVSLRDWYSTDAHRIAKVPLGSIVSECYWFNSEFIYCEYEGNRGYIQAKYLTQYRGNDVEQIYLDDMIVVNCDSWVSLRTGANTAAERLVKVPLGGVVKNCIKYDSEYIYGEYGGFGGYIQSKYLVSAVEEENVNGSYDFIGDMNVVNCDSWVSLRAEPSTSASRLAKIPLGAAVQNCSWYSGEFIRCEYQGMEGYVKAEYLEKSTGDDGFSSVADANELYSIAPDGKVITANREYTNEGEVLTVVCTEADGTVVWTTEETAEPTQLDNTAAFVGGTESYPMIMVYNAFEQLRALNPKDGSELWSLPMTDISLGGSVSTALGEDGTLYIGGYLGPDPTAISVDGRVLWQTQNDHNAFWLSGLELTEDGLLAYFDAVNTSDTTGEILYDLDGNEILFTVH